MKISEIISFLESLANPALQEHYDNAGLITGQSDSHCTGIICSLDATENVVQEAIDRKCNMVVAHHPIIFSGLKKINGKNYVEKTIISAIKNDIAIYAIHTNLDNVITGVTGKMATMLGLQNITVLSPKENTLKKLYTFAPVEKADHVRMALFAAGAGYIGNYSETSFNTDGTGTFKAGEGANPFVGDIGKLHHEKETKIEVLFPAYFEKRIIAALLAAHPYEEVAYDIVTLSNANQKEGSGILGELPAAMKETAFLMQLKQTFKLKIIRHSPLLNRSVKKVALCGGAGSFLISKALASGADIFVTADMKYHEFFDANGRMVIADIGHYESEQFTIDLLAELLEKKFPTFAVLKTKAETNPVRYF
jgi:dinuclear metal center YbgI/SA1388 family protein